MPALLPLPAHLVGWCPKDLLAPHTDRLQASPPHSRSAVASGGCSRWHRNADYVRLRHISRSAHVAEPQPRQEQTRFGLVAQHSVCPPDSVPRGSATSPDADTAWPRSGSVWSVANDGDTSALRLPCPESAVGAHEVTPPHLAMQRPDREARDQLPLGGVLDDEIRPL